MADFKEITIEGDGITLSRLVWRLYRKPAPEIITRTLDANPHIGRESLDPILPVGTVVRVVWDQSVADGRKVQKLVRLYGVA